jgi:SAM-dependent methyltransferase
LLYSLGGCSPKRKESAIRKTIQDEVLSLVNDHPAYRLRPFVPILEEMVAQTGSIQGLKGKAVLELGPGSRVNLLRFLHDRGEAGEVLGVGRAPAWPWRRQRAFLEEKVKNIYMLDFLRQGPGASFDLIYSRHVMEHYSIDPWILLCSGKYWRQFKDNRFRNPGVDFPSSRINIQAIFQEAFRLLKPGGAVISQIAKKKHSWLDRAFLEKLGVECIRERLLGKLSCIITVVKKDDPGAIQSDHGVSG